MKTKSTSQTPRTLTRNAILLAITALALSAWPTVALAADCPNKSDTVWTGAVDHNWFNSGNWTNGVPICNNNVSSTAGINNGGTAQINYPNASACEVTLGANATDSGTLSVDGSGSNLTTCRNISVGYQGKGSLSITNGGVVTTDVGASIAWGATSNTSSNGAVTVKGTNSTWAVSDELDIGGTTNASGGTGLLAVTNGGTVTAMSVHAWKSGTLTGNGTVSTTSGMTIDGTLEPSGTLTISGNLTFANPTANMRCNVSSTSWDRAEVSGVATLNGKLSVTLSGLFTGDFTLLHADNGLNNTKFSSYSFTYTGCLSPSIVYHYDTGDVILHVESTCQ